MRFSYFPETDTLYIRFAERPGVDVLEISDGIIADIDQHGAVVGLELDPAHKVADLQGLTFERLPTTAIHLL